jgi:hypothetical protein
MMSFPVESTAPKARTSFIVGIVGSVFARRFNSVIYFFVQNRPLPNQDVETAGILPIPLGPKQLDVVSDFPLQAYVAHNAFAGVGVNARHVAGVRITIGVAVSYVEKNENVMTVGQYAIHGSLPFQNLWLPLVS